MWVQNNLELKLNLCVEVVFFVFLSFQNKCIYMLFFLVFVFMFAGDDFQGVSFAEK